jgi:ABC-2 type transport system permease protein
MKISVRKDILKTLLKKEFKQLFRDKRMLVMLFVTPMIMLILLGYGVNTDVKKIKIAIFDEDRTSESRKFIRIFIASPYFTYYTYLESENEIADLLNKGKVDIFMHIPVRFSKNVKSGKHVDVQIILDGTDSNRAAMIMAYINQITNEFSLDYFTSRIKLLILSRGIGGVRISETIGIQERALFNPELLSRNFYLPGVLGLLISVLTIMLTSMAVVKEKESGTIEQIIVTPLRPVEYIIGKTMPFAIIAFFDLCIIPLMAIIWFNVPFNGNFIFLLISGMIYIISALAVGLYISTVSKTQQEAMLSTFVYFLPAMLFSGFVFPIYAMPEMIRLITYINPMRYFIEIIRGIFLKGVGITVLWPQLIILVFMGVLLLVLSVRRFARRME